MYALFQRLRELDKDTFQRLCYQIISARHPGLGVHHVDGPGGDGGIDAFMGQLDNGPTIWQCKHFPNGLGKAQRAQVRGSLNTAIRNYHPSTWILVVPIDLDDKAHAWLQKLGKSRLSEVQIALFQASDIVRELIRRRDIREAFFQGAVIDTLMATRALRGLASMTNEEIGEAATGNLDELLARLEKEDARFNYQIVYGPNVGADVAEKPPSHPSLIASVIDEKKRVDIFAHDIRAIELDPPRVGFLLTGAGIEKLKEFERTGRQQELGVDEVSQIRSTFDFLLPKGAPDRWKIVFRQNQNLSRRTIGLKMVFSNTGSSVTYDCIDFKTKRAGTDEAELESVSNLPFKIKLLIRSAAGKGDVAVAQNFAGADVTAVAKVLRAFSLLRDGGKLELSVTQTGAPLGYMEMFCSETEDRKLLLAVVGSAAEIAERFHTPLRVPNVIQQEDFARIVLLQTMLDGRTLPASRLSGGIIKDSSSARALYDSIDAPLTISLAEKRLEPIPQIFGTMIDTGPVALLAEDAKVLDKESFLDRYGSAADGDNVQVEFESDKVRVKFGEVEEYGLFIRPDSPAEMNPNSKTE